MQRPHTIDEEFFFDGGKIVSETDLKGVITYVNRQCCVVSGYELNELLHQPHDIVRHPDMPKTAFQQMWQELSMGNEWHGYVKNLRKDGRYYWLETNISPVYNDHKKITGFIAASGLPQRKNIKQVIDQYNKLSAVE